VISCTVAIMAYNEEANIGRLLEALLQQRLKRVQIVEIVVVTSGCTDGTDQIVASYARRYPQVRHLRQPRREGKASAINLALRTIRQEVIVLHSADTIPAPDAIEHLVRPFEDPEVGMTGSRPVPTNDPRRFMGYAAHLEWQLHHQISLHRPKMGEVIAFRNIFRQIPYDSAVDEASIEPLIRGQGLRLVYVPEAIIYNRGPETLSDFLKQRRRIYAGHLYVRDMLGYRVSTMSGRRILPLFLKEILFPSPTPPVPGQPARRVGRLRHLVWGPLVAALELYGRLLGRWDYTIWRRKPFVWPVAETTKEVVEVGQVGL